jgi:hypothetical protein
MAWLVLIVAGLFEIGWAVGLKYTEGFTRLWPTLGTVLSMTISLGLLGLALRTLPLGTAYQPVDEVVVPSGRWSKPILKTIRAGTALLSTRTMRMAA